MFLFPPSMWVGNIFYEHTHRLYASFIGLLTTALAVWLWVREPRRWMRWLGVIAFCAVLFQGILGGLRVVLLKSEIGIFHACLAHTFFCLLVAVAIFTSKWWKQAARVTVPHPARLQTLCWVATAIIFLQLALGASMRHSQSGLAIPDFPLAYGQLVPATDAAALEEINAERVWRMHLEPVSAGQIWIHFSHRIGAILVSVAVLFLVGVILFRHRQCRPLPGLAVTLLAAFLVQIFLGAWTVLSGKAADIATTHVAVGALILATSFATTLVSHRLLAPVSKKNEMGEHAIAGNRSALLAGPIS